MEPDLRHEEREGEGLWKEGAAAPEEAGEGTNGGLLLHCEPHDAAVGSWLCNNCSGGAPEKLSRASSQLMFVTRGSELGWRLEEGSWKTGDWR